VCRRKHVVDFRHGERPVQSHYHILGFFYTNITHRAESQNTTRTGDETTRPSVGMMNGIDCRRHEVCNKNVYEYQRSLFKYYCAIIESSNAYTSVLHYYYYYYYVLYVLCVVRSTHITRNGARFLHKEIVNVITASIGYAVRGGGGATDRPTDRLANLTDRRRTLYRARQMSALRNDRRDRTSKIKIIYRTHAHEKSHYKYYYYTVTNA